MEPKHHTHHHKKEKKGFNYKKLFIPVIIILALLILFLYFRVGDTTITDGTIVQIDYIGQLEDGQIFDTSLEDVAKENNLYNEYRDYKPLEFQIGTNQVIPGFETAIKTMKVGETKTVTIVPEEGYGKIDESLILKNREKEIIIEKISTLTPTEFKQIFNREPKVNEVISEDVLPWDMKVLSIKGDQVEFEALLSVGDTVVLNGISWSSRVLKINGNNITIKQYPQEGDPVIIPTNSGNKPGIVRDVKDDTYNIDLNHPLAGKKLTFKITLISKQ